MQGFIFSLHSRIIAREQQEAELKKSTESESTSSTFYIWRIGLSLLGAQSTMLHLLFPLSAQELHFISSIFNLAPRQRAKKNEKGPQCDTAGIEQSPLKDVRRNSHYQLVSLAFFAFYVSYLESPIRLHPFVSLPPAPRELHAHRRRIICC